MKGTRTIANAAALSSRFSPPSITLPSSLTRMRSEALIRLKAVPNGFTQNVSGSTGSRYVIWPLGSVSLLSCSGNTLACLLLEDKTHRQRLHRSHTSQICGTPQRDGLSSTHVPCICHRKQEALCKIPQHSIFKRRRGTAAQSGRDSLWESGHLYFGLDFGNAGLEGCQC